MSVVLKHLMILEWFWIDFCDFENLQKKNVVIFSEFDAPASIQKQEKPTTNQNENQQKK